MEGKFRKLKLVLGGKVAEMREAEARDHGRNRLLAGVARRTVRRYAVGAYSC
jgi:hypothetical protein